MRQALRLMAILLGMVVVVALPVLSGMAEEPIPNWLLGVWEGTLSWGSHPAAFKLEFQHDAKVKMWGRNPQYEFEGVGAVKVSASEVSIEGTRDAPGRRSSRFTMSLKRTGDNQLEGTYFGGSNVPNQASLKKTR